MATQTQTQMAASTAPSIINELDNTVALQRSETEPFGLNWTSYSTPALHDIVTDSIKELTALTRRGQKELRQRLLPALQEVRSRINKGEAVDGYDTMKAYLAAVGLSEDTIRQWEFRLREKELKELGFEVDAAPAVEDGPELDALLAPLTAEELESDQKFESTLKATATETPEPKESDLARLRQLLKGTGLELTKSDHGSKYRLDNLTAAQVREIATGLVSE